MERYDAFVSYSRADEELVKAVVAMLRVGGRRIFLDATEIAPGERWPQRIADAVTNSSVVVILWCCHAGRSMFVRDEVTQAVAASRALVPVLLCPFPLTSTIADYQWIDCQKIVVHVCQKHAGSNEPDREGYDVESFLADADVTKNEVEHIVQSWNRVSLPPARLRTGCLRPSFMIVAVFVLSMLAMTVTTADYPFLSIIESTSILLALLILAMLALVLRLTRERLPLQYRTEGVSIRRPEHVLALVIEVAVRDATRAEARMR